MTELERRLRDLGEHLDTPAGDELADTVARRLDEHHRSPARRVLVAAAVVLAGGAALTPAVAGWLGTDEVAIEQTPPPSTARPSPSNPSTTVPLDLGRQVSLAEAETMAGFRPILPAMLGEPDEVWVDDRAETPLVWLRWEDEALLTELEGHLLGEPAMRKFATGDVEVLQVGRRRAYWVEGAHQVGIEDHDGDVVVLRLRTADSTLLVDMGTFTVRIETTAGRETALRIAESLPGT